MRCRSYLSIYLWTVRTSILKNGSSSHTDAGPPSQSLGVDPVDPAIMRKPPRKKDEPIITKQLLYRVLFSASIIVVGTLFIYILSLSDEHVSRREQTMVSSVCLGLAR
jgi:magnesium-transporting ATPase (P-type)